MIWLLLFACKSAPEAPRTLDAKLYSDATLADDFEAGLRLCTEISSDTLGSECEAFLVQQHGRTSPLRAEEVCTLQAPGIWKDECFFLLAEALTVPEKPETAAQFCRASGRYYRPCFMHLFSAHAGHLLSAAPEGKIPEAYAQAIALGGKNPPKDFEHLAWSLLFRRQTLSLERFAPEECDPLNEQAIACRSGVREALLRTLQQKTRSISDAHRSQICEYTTTTATVLGPVIAKDFGVSLSPHPSLDAPLTRWHTQLCRSIQRK